MFKGFSHPLLIASATLLLTPTTTLAAVITFSDSGADPASIQDTVDAFRATLGNLNPNVVGSLGSGRREINWDGVPDTLSAPNNLPPDFFNINSPRGAVFSTPGSGVQVSARAGIAPIDFDNINDTYSSIFQTFSPQRLFTALDSNIVEVNFFVPGTNTPAVVSGFGSVFTDVDFQNSTKIEYFDVGNNLLFSSFVQPANNGLSFLGAFFNEGEGIAKVRITSGNAPLSPNNFDGGNLDIVVMDDFLYGEPIEVAQVVPEPSTTLGLFIGGVLCFVGFSRKHRRS